MASLTYFSVNADMLAVVGAAGAPATVPIRGKVTFTPMIHSGDALVLTTLSPRPGLVSPQPVTGVIGSDGQLGFGGSVGVRLIADTSVLGLTSPLFYTVDFVGLTVNGQPRQLTSFEFQAATSDTAVNLVSVARVPGQPASGVVNSVVPNHVRRVGATVVFSANGVDIGDPVDLTTTVEPPITGGTTSQYWRGDKSFQTLNKTAVGLSNVDNTPDASKPVSTAQGAAIAAAQAASQPVDTDLTAISGLTATTDNFMVAAGSAWASRTPSQAKTSLSLTPSDVAPTSSAPIATNTAPSANQITVYDATAGALAVTLPALSGLTAGSVYPVQKSALDLSPNWVTLTPNGSDAFDSGATSEVLKLTGQFRVLQVVLISAAKKWKVVTGNTTISSLTDAYVPPHPGFASVMTRLKHNRSSVIQGIGDSTMEFGGWLYPFADTLGAYADASVWVCGWGHTTAEMYDDPVVRSTSSQGARSIFTQSAFAYGPPLAGGNLTVTLKVKPSTSWNSVQFLITKWNDTGNQRGFSFGTTTVGGPALAFSFSVDGTSGTQKNATSSATIPFADGTAGWIRAVYTAASAKVQFYTSTDGVTWTQLGADVTVSGGTSMFGAPTNPFALCLRGSSGVATGHTFYYTQVRDSSGADLVPRLPEKWDSPYSAVTINGGPTILVMTGGKSGQTLAYYDDPTRRPLLLTAKGLDVILVADGHNDAVSGFGPNYLTYVKHVQFLKPGVPIIATTQNPTKIGSSITTQEQIDSGKQKSAVLAPVLSNLAGVSVLDTHPAYYDLATLIGSDGLHPALAGYLAQAAYMIRKLAPEAS